jgi:hypothetical protein
MQTLGEIHSYSDLHRILRDRRALLEVSLDGLDVIVGLTRGHSSKLFAPSPLRRLGMSTLGPVLEALGVKLIAAVDEDAEAKHAARIAEHKSRSRGKQRMQPTISPEVIRAARELMHKERVKDGRRGGKVRAAKLSMEDRSRSASVANRARWAAMPPAARQREITRMNEARRRQRRVG